MSGLSARVRLWQQTAHLGLLTLPRAHLGVSQVHQPSWRAHRASKGGDVCEGQVEKERDSAGGSWGEGRGKHRELHGAGST